MDETWMKKKSNLKMQSDLKGWKNILFDILDCIDIGLYMIVEIAYVQSSILFQFTFGERFKDIYWTNIMFQGLNVSNNLIFQDIWLGDCIGIKKSILRWEVVWLFIPGFDKYEF